MADVAKLAGVSLSTVSYAFSGARPISEATKARVMRAVEQLDFQPNAMARGLAGRRTGFLALLLPTDEAIADQFMVDIIVAAAETARERGYHLLLWTEPAGESTAVKDLMRRGLIDGALLLSVRLFDERVGALQEAGVPLTMVGRTQDPVDSHYVDSDAEQAAELAISHLAELGHTTVAYLGPPQSAYDDGIGIVVRVHDSLVESAQHHRVKLISVFSERNAAASAEAMSQLMTAEPEVTAVLALDDSAVAGILNGLRSLDLAVPGDVSLVGLFTSPQIAELTWPHVTSVSHDPRDLGRLASLTMIDSLNGTSGFGTQTLLPSEVFRRSTTGPPPAANR
ncbi:LacI family DNA-binding transcriptional regulator [Candidatus Poriferisocius sp.]|uniref:LacI family DNA-binding transcriptional regulator n=1 Tax=Candidatus Poriferisocius sp. TaxID=3101276 RepID=UPI003B52EBF3